jgi:uncharacterized protein (TIGR00725 family)
MDTSICNRKFISVCCAGCPGEQEEKLAYEVGREIALRGAVLVTGGLGGSMESACKGAKENGGLTIGILPTYEKNTANKWVDIIIPTGLGHSRNNLVVATGDAVIGVGGSWGTLSELAIAMKTGKPVVVLEGWRASTSGIPEPGFRQAGSALEAVSMALEKC